MLNYTSADGERLMAEGQPMVKKPNPVYMERQTEDFRVETTEGPLTGRAGDFVAYDPISGHVWPVQSGYVSQHYEDAPPPRPRKPATPTRL